MSRPALGSLCALIIAACASSPAPRLYVLTAPLGPTSTPTAATATATATAGIRIQLLPVSIPDYLDNEEILVRQGEHELRASSTGQWGERLSEGVTHALGASLKARLPGYVIDTGRTIDLGAQQITVIVDTLDCWSDGRCSLGAHWHLREPGGEPGQAEGRATFVTKVSPSGDAADAAVISGLAAAVAQLADRLASYVLDSARPLPPQPRRL